MNKGSLKPDTEIDIIQCSIQGNNKHNNHKGKNKNSALDDCRNKFDRSIRINCALALDFIDFY
jgi:hypothetical protein